MYKRQVLYTIPKEIYKKLNDTNTAVKDYTMEMVSERFSDVMWLPQVVGKDAGYAQLKLSSGELRIVREECLATVGAVSNEGSYVTE